MQFQHIKWQLIQPIGMRKTVLIALTWQPKYYMRTGMNTTLCCLSYCPLALCIRMPSIYALKCAVQRTLYPILQHHITLLAKSCKIVQHLIINAIRASTNHQPYHLIHLQHRLIQSPQLIKRSISICICLKICQIQLSLITTKKLYSLLHLLHNRLGRLTIFRKESLIITKRTPSPSLHAIAIRTSKTRIDRNLLHPSPKLLPQYLIVICVHLIN